jgi:hypothetical protein
MSCDIDFTPDEFSAFQPLMRIQFRRQYYRHDELRHYAIFTRLLLYFH